MMHFNVSNILTLLVTLILHGYIIQTAADDPVVVDIVDGTLQGRTVTTAAGTTYYSFQGIPYAKPPVGDLRFKEPQPAEHWEGVKDATQLGSVCPQAVVSISGISTNVTVVGNEDCLYVNVYTTQLPSNNTPLKLPVMVWIHGGAFSSGSGNTDWYGPDYILDNGDIILVTLNYRLGALGLLGLDHPEVSKNNALKDQVAALKWVHNNIDKFGGDPDDVTIFGESAGGGSVHYQLLTPLSEGLFHKAIGQSGSALDQWAYIDPGTAHDRAIALADQMKLDTTDPSEILDSLTKADAIDIVSAQELMSKPLYMHLFGDANVMFTVTLEDDAEGAFLPDTPINLLKSGKFHQVPYVTGTTSAEGKTFAWGERNDAERLKNFDDNFEEFVPIDLGYTKGSPESLAVAKELKEQYFGNKTVSPDTIQQLVSFMSDYGIVIGVHRAVMLQYALGKAPIYRYLFSYEGRLGLTVLNNMNFSFKGAGHGDEIFYIFKPYSVPIDLPEDSAEMKTVRRITKLWTDFAKSGNPAKTSDINWQPLSENSQTFLNIDTDLTVEDWSDFEPENIALWENIYKDLDKINNKL